MKPSGAICCALVLLLTACLQKERRRCAADGDCHPDFRCVETACILDPLPRVVLHAGRDAARLGEEVELDGSQSQIPGDAALEFEFLLAPEDVGTLILSPEHPGKARLRIQRPHQSAAIKLRVTSPSGRVAEREAAIQPLNGAPSVRIQAPEALQPGEEIELLALATDPEGDPLTYTWTLEGPGQLRAHGERAWLESGEGTEEERFEVRVEVTDGLPRGKAQASVRFTAANLPPAIELASPLHVEHRCEGEPLACSATIPLEAAVRDVGPVETQWSLVSPLPEGIELRFLPSATHPTAAELRCSPACPLAGTYTFAVEATDAWGASSRVELQAVVRNRPPLLIAHDGGVLDHVHEDGVYRMERPPGSGALWWDPDGDPPAPDSVQWSSDSPLLRFDDETRWETGLVVEGSLEQLGEPVPLAVRARDINDAEGSAESALLMGNRAPVVRWSGDHREGYLRVEGEPPAFEKEIDLSAAVIADPDGDPLETTLRLGSGDLPPGLTLEGEAPRWRVRGPLSALGAEIPVVLQARDSFGAEGRVEAVVRVANRPPLFLPPSPEGVIRSPAALACAPICCSAASCDPLVQMVTQWEDGESGPWRWEGIFRVQDPEGAPLARLALEGSGLLVKVGGSWAPLPQELPCEVEAGDFRCPLSLLVLPPEGCVAGEGGSPPGGEAELEARVVDEAGAESSRSLRFAIEEAPCP